MPRSISYTALKFWAAFLILSARFLCKVLPFRSLLSLISSRRIVGIFGSRTFSSLELRAIFSESENLGWLKGSCFENSCALYVFLRGFEYNPEFWLSCSPIRTTTPAAHAWIRCEGLNFDSKPQLGLIPFSAPLLR